MTQAVIPTSRREYKFWSKVIAYVAAVPTALAIVSIIQQRFGGGLIPALQDILDYYRQLYYPVVDHVRRLLSQVPFVNVYSEGAHYLYTRYLPVDIYKDLTALSVISFVAHVRAMFYASSSFGQPGVASDDSRDPTSWFVLVLAVAIGTFAVPIIASALIFSLVPLLFPLAPFVPPSMREPETYRPYMLSLLTAFAAAASFYVVNAILKAMV